MSDVADSLGTVTDSLGNKVGPLPVWAWAGMAAAGVSAAILIRRRMMRGTVGDAAEPGVEGEPGDVLDEMVGSSSPFLPGGFVIGGGPTQATGSTGTPEPGDAPAAPRTNSDWQLDAQRFLIGRGYQGTVVTDALARFLSGRALTPQGSAIIDAAIAAVGAPPQPVPPPTVSPSPEPLPSPGGGGTAPKPAPPKVSKPAATAGDIVVTVQPGMTLWGLAQQYRAGGTIQAAQARIAKYNGIRLGPAPAFRPTPWAPGQRVRIPGPSVVV